MSKLKVEVMLVTPKLAMEWLAKSEGNRETRYPAVAAYAGQMTRGHWLLNGEPIIFDETGRLIDGHHRLLAVVVSDVSVEMLVVWGVEKGSVFTLDSGVIRGLRDHHALHGGTNSTRRASILNGIGRIVVGQSVNLKTMEDYRMFEPFFREGTERFFEMGMANKSWLVRTSVSCPLILAHKVSPTKVEKFWVDLRDGQELSAGDPVLALREYLMRYKSNDRMARADTFDTTVDKVLGAVEAAIEGRSLKKLQPAAEATERIRKFYLKSPALKERVEAAQENRRYARLLADRFSAGETTAEDLKKFINEQHEKK